MEGGTAVSDISEESSGPEPLAKETALEMAERHVSERVELTRRYERRRSSIPRKDREARSRLAEDQASEERQMNERHATELKTLPEGAIKSHTLGTGLPPKNSGAEGSAGPRESRAARRRRAKAKREAESDARVKAAHEAESNLPSEKELESAAIERQLSERGFTLHPIPPDGHCLYSAVAHQMQEVKGVSFGIEPTVSAVRQGAAEYMLSHSEDFLPFMEGISDMHKFKDYCEKVRGSAAWGGELELRAIAGVLRVTILVFAANMPILPMKSEEKRDGEDVVLRVSFHRKYYGLGEHYNSVVSAT